VSRKNRSFHRQLLQIQNKIELQYEGTVDRLINKSKQIEWIKSNYDKFPDETPTSRKSVTHDLSFAGIKNYKKKNSIISKNNKKKPTFQDYKNSRSVDRVNQTRLEIIKDKIKKKIVIRAKNPFHLYKGFNRRQRKYDIEYKLMAKRPKTAAKSRNLGMNQSKLSFVTNIYSGGVRN
jgi:hypothetical protein